MQFNHCRSRCVTYMHGAHVRFRFRPQSTVGGITSGLLPSTHPRLLADADIVCSRAKIHYDPNSNLDLSETGTFAGSTQAGNQLQAFQQGFRPLHNNMRFVMYFS